MFHIVFIFVFALRQRRRKQYQEIIHSSSALRCVLTLIAQSLQWEVGKAKSHNSSQKSLYLALSLTFDGSPNPTFVAIGHDGAVRLYHSPLVFLLKAWTL